MQFIASAIWIFSLLLVPALLRAQTPDNACPQRQAELDANKKLLQDFFSFTGPLQARAERFLAADYIQHNPRLLRLDETTGAQGRDAWVKAFQEAARRGAELVDLGGIQFDKPVIVMAECDLVTAVYKGVLADPDRPGKTYEAFAFETFRVRDKQFTEHWDQVTLKPGWLPPPADAAAGKATSSAR